jgi:lysophospholipase L1-like esterase
VNHRRNLGLFLLLALLALTLPAAAKFSVSPRANLVLFGDSITANGEYGQIMQELIDARFPERQIRVLSHGSHGDTARGAMRRVEEEVVVWQPEWVFINFGINDVGNQTTAEFLTNYQVLLNRILRDTKARVAIVSPVYPDRDTPHPRLVEYVAGLRELAGRFRVTYVPLFETEQTLRGALPAGVKYAVDGSHPNALGCWMIAQTLLEALDFPLARTPWAVAIPARHLVSDQSDARAGETFTVALPMPLKVTMANPPLKAASCKRAGKPIKLDGKLDDWDMSAPLTLKEPDQRVWGVVSWARDGHYAAAYTCYTPDAWYFAIAVNDAYVRCLPEPRNSVSRDCVELCLDLRPAEEKKVKPWIGYAPSKPQVYQYVLTPTTKETPMALALMGNGDRKMLDGVTIASAPTKVGYIIEVRVPAAHFPGGVLAPGLSVGFDFAAINVDRQDNYLTAVEFRWSGSNGSAFSTREFGTLTMAE